MQYWPLSTGYPLEIELLSVEATDLVPQYISVSSHKLYTTESTVSYHVLYELTKATDKLNYENMVMPAPAGKFF